MLINASSLGINKNDKIDLNYEKIGTNKFYYDVIYNPAETHFLKEAKNLETKLRMVKKCLFIKPIKHLQFGITFYQK